jgi:very-short-patch-repair endonuclease
MNRTNVRQKRIERMLNGGAIKALAGIKNPSASQVKTFKISQQVLLSPILNYPDYFTGYSIDIAEPKLAIAIECDGSYWHQEKDLKRQKELEEQGWNFIRYTDHVPTKQQLKEDIKRILNNG